MRILLAALALLPSLAAAEAPGTWRFAVSGDSRNCGDVVMPAIARDALAQGASFYWHLGDFRKTYDFDEDMKAARPDLTIAAYLGAEWDDFIRRQLAPFGGLPVYLSIGNHETIPPKTRADYLAQFADWLDAPDLRAQRLADDPDDRRLRTYYRVKRGGLDLVTLDNASEEQFDKDQLKWLEATLARDAQDPEVRALVVGMHRALPNSWSCGHSMNESAAGTESGRRAYRDLLRWRARTGKPVYALASHSHFVMSGLYDTPYWRAKKEDRGVLPGWIVGTAGAIRYALPPGLPAGAFAKTKVYGYLLAAVAPDGKVGFDFREVRAGDVPAEVVSRYGRALVDSCFAGNSDDRADMPAPSCSDE